MNLWAATCASVYFPPLWGSWFSLNTCVLHQARSDISARWLVGKCYLLHVQAAVPNWAAATPSTISISPRFIGTFASLSSVGSNGCVSHADLLFYVCGGDLMVSPPRGICSRMPGNLQGGNYIPANATREDIFSISLHDVSVPKWTYRGFKPSVLGMPVFLHLYCVYTMQPQQISAFTHYWLI